MSARILVAGLGNVLMGDDGIGPYCVRQLTACYQFPANVEVADLGTPGLDLALYLSKADRVLVIDAMRGAPRDTIAIHDMAAIVSGARGGRLEAHSLALAESVFLARLAGGRPHDVRLIGLAGSSFEHGTTLSPNVRERIPALVEQALGELAQWNVVWACRRTTAPADAWREGQRDAAPGRS